MDRGSLTDGFSDMKRKVSNYIGVPEEEQDEDQTMMEEMRGMCPTMTVKQRWYGFGICFVLGWFISFLSVITVGSIATNPGRFAFLYTFGSLVSISSTCFIWGPCRQCKRMFEWTRLLATSIYVLTMILTLYLAFSHASPILILFSILMQFLAMCWYVLTWIPYGRKMATKCMEGICPC
eukprot:1134288_1